MWAPVPTFNEAFGRPPEVLARAPGRVNLLGEHTDYNEGFVLPTVIPRETRVELGQSADGRFRYYSGNLDLLIELESDQPAPPGFARYVHGCIEVLRARGIGVPPCSVRIESDIPIGRGLSSSAALEVAMLRAVRARMGLPLDDVEIALLAHGAEVEFAGVRCGILDQMAVSLGRPGQMLFLDTRTLERRLLPLPAAADILVVDSGVTRELVSTEYNARRSECEKAARLLGVRTLRDITDVADCAALPVPLNRRARHVVAENRRTVDGAGAADAGEFGILMNASHASLRDDFEVSVPALDQLVVCMQQRPETHGARLTGAGFGGACVALVRRGSVDAVAGSVLRCFADYGYRGERLA
jgi:galactokinase